MHCKCHKTNYRRGGSYTDSSDWIKKEKAKINLKHKNTCFQYAAIVLLNHDEIESHPKRVSKMKPFINKCK